MRVVLHSHTLHTSTGMVQQTPFIVSHTETEPGLITIQREEIAQ